LPSLGGFRLELRHLLAELGMVGGKRRVVREEVSPREPETVTLVTPGAVGRQGLRSEGLLAEVPFDPFSPSKAARSCLAGSPSAAAATLVKTAAERRWMKSVFTGML
jgi:hypothetical protein